VNRIILTVTEINILGVGKATVPNKADRNPSMTPVIGFNAYIRRYFSGTKEAG